MQSSLHVLKLHQGHRMSLRTHFLYGLGMRMRAIPPAPLFELRYVMSFHCSPQTNVIMEIHYLDPLPHPITFIRSALCTPEQVIRNGLWFSSEKTAPRDLLSLPLYWTNTHPRKSNRPCHSSQQSVRSAKSFCGLKIMQASTIHRQHMSSPLQQFGTHL